MGAAGTACRTSLEQVRDQKDNSNLLHAFGALGLLQMMHMEQQDITDGRKSKAEQQSVQSRPGPCTTLQCPVQGSVQQAGSQMQGQGGPASG